MSPLLRSQARRPEWWFGLLDVRFGIGSALLVALIIIDANPRAFAQPRSATSNSATSEKFPPWTDVQGALTDFFKREPNYKTGDLITREQGERFLALLPKFGWKIAEEDRKKLLEKFLPADHFMAKEFRTPAGTKFMRKISQYPLGYDRAQRLIGLPGGRDRLQELIRGPDGYKLIEYMADAKGGKNLGLMLGDVSGGKNFNQPTGNLYTESALQKQLQALHQKAEADWKEKDGKS